MKHELNYKCAFSEIYSTASKFPGALTRPNGGDLGLADALSLNVTYRYLCNR
jgi:hypothetical protein